MQPHTRRKKVNFYKKNLSIRSGAHKLFLHFFAVFANFDRKFAQIVAPPGGGNVQSLMRLKGQTLLKKYRNRIKIDPRTLTQYLFKLYTTWRRSVKY